MKALMSGRSAFAALFALFCCFALVSGCGGGKAENTAGQAEEKTGTAAETPAPEEPAPRNEAPAPDTADTPGEAAVSEKADTAEMTPQELRSAAEGGNANAQYQ